MGVKKRDVREGEVHVCMPTTHIITDLGIGGGHKSEMGG